MICPRCGTEHNDPNNICPRCFLGRPKEKAKLPKWLVLTLSIGGSAIALVLAIVISVAVVRATAEARMLEGVWENSDIALIISHGNKGFQLINGENVITGKYEMEEGELRLAADDGKHYIYYYEFLDDNTLKISFADGQYIIRETLERVQYGE